MFVQLILIMLFTVLSLNTALIKEVENMSYVWTDGYDRLLKDKPYHWKDILQYYYPTLEHKLDAILYHDCKKSYQILPEDNAIIVPLDRGIVNVIPFPVSRHVEQFWLNIPKPKQMRVDPFLCEAVYVKKRPIFNNTGCQLPHYMNSGAPRCQTSILKWICEHASIAIDNPSSNGFVLPESDHSTWIKPPLPWLLTIRDSFVTMCGQIASKCGRILSETL
jgi:hypothetical protein